MLGFMDICTERTVTPRPTFSSISLHLAPPPSRLLPAWDMWRAKSVNNSYVFADDMFHREFAKYPSDGREMRRYKHAVLEKGCAQDEMATLTQFWGDSRGWRQL